MIFYLVDENALTVGEEARHRSACNAAISSGKTVPEAFDVADETIREMRRRIVAASAPPPPTKFALVDEEQLVQRWVEAKTTVTPPQNQVIRKMREVGQPMYLAELAKASNVRNEVIRQMVAARILVPVEGGENR